MSGYKLRNQILESIRANASGDFSELELIGVLTRVRELEQEDVTARAALQAHENAIKTIYDQNGWRSHCSFEYFAENFARETGAAPGSAEEKLGKQYVDAKRYSTSIWLDYCACRTNIEQMIFEPQRALRDAGLSQDFAQEYLPQKVVRQAALLSLSDQDFAHFKNRAAVMEQGQKTSLETARKELAFLTKTKTRFEQFVELAGMNFNVVKLLKKHKANKARAAATKLYIIEMQSKSLAIQAVMVEFQKAEYNRAHNQYNLISKQPPEQYNVIGSRRHNSIMEDGDAPVGLAEAAWAIALEEDEATRAAALKKGAPNPKLYANLTAIHPLTTVADVIVDDLRGAEETAIATAKADRASQRLSIFDDPSENLPPRKSVEHTKLLALAMAEKARTIHDSREWSRSEGEQPSAKKHRLRIPTPGQMAYKFRDWLVSR